MTVNPPAGSGLIKKQVGAITLTSGQTTTVNVVLQQPATITGTVTDASGAHYEVLVDEPSTSPLDVGAWLPVDISGSSVTDVNATLMHGTAGTISGTVSGPDGKPIADVEVLAAEADGYAWPATTAADGSYTIKGIPPGVDVGLAYVWFVPPPQYHVTLGNLAVGKVLPVEVDPGANVTGIDATLTATGDSSISGTVTDASGAPVAGANVTITNVFGFTDGSAKTDANGHYNAAGLGAGLHRVEFSYGIATQRWNNEPDAAHSDTLNVPDHGNATANGTFAIAS